MRGVIQRAGWPACGVIAIACILAVVKAPRSDILTTIGIAVPPATDLSVLTGSDDYPTWHPSIAGLKSRLEKGWVIENIEG
ncbi:hypothetical protein [Lichenicoccus roseus]|uniref:Uncharacterized protein n=1 Tax=Lichenicoccus roseus TaxID=2683649 RepID=A0A5R9IZ54_9PROT|nr:hypothetical protein [Lichenicoccus roseus]TLU70760.1 hypothetical protein FE263_20575 [Lichenicoccus roseus]